MAQELPNARWLQIPGAGHAPHLTHPAEVEAAMARFLAHVGEPDMHLVAA
jgi:pimeloyl-ACP methyl ester carboxylesterase